MTAPVGRAPRAPRRARIRPNGMARLRHPFRLHMKTALAFLARLLDLLAAFDARTSLRPVTVPVRK